MFSQVSVCPRARGVCHTPPGQTPLRQTPWVDTPLGRHPPKQTPPGQTPLVPLHAGIHTPPPAQCMLGYTPPLPSACWDAVNKRAVRIPLECILVCLNLGEADQSALIKILAKHCHFICEEIQSTCSQIKNHIAKSACHHKCRNCFSFKFERNLLHMRSDR